MKAHVYYGDLYVFKTKIIQGLIFAVSWTLSSVWYSENENNILGDGSATVLRRGTPTHMIPLERGDGMDTPARWR
jgi:hypothetical protein